MNTFTEDQKSSWIKVMQSHQDADRITQGLWWDGSKGCFFGCAMEENNVDLKNVARIMNLPLWLVRLAERIHEGLSTEEAVCWPVRLLKSIPTNADVSDVPNDLTIMRLLKLSKKHPSVSREIDQVIKLTIKGGDSTAWSAARSAAWSAAESAAESAAWSAAESAAWSAAWSASSAARSAAIKENIKTLRELFVKWESNNED